MPIWVDGDACPAATKEILFRAAERTATLVTLVANQPLRVPRSPWIRAIQVPRGFDVADARIVELARPRDLVITADIPLASAVVGRGAEALNPRGELYTSDNVQGLLDLRNFMDTLRAGGVDTGGPPPLSNADRKAFATQLERWLRPMGDGPS